MNNLYSSAKLGHIIAQRRQGDAAQRVLSKADFATAYAEITSWQDYAPTPLISLHELAAKTGVGEILYKHEGSRFGLSSFKALGGAYAALRVLQREITRKTGQDFSLSDIRTGQYQKECTAITLVSATDGNHGRSLAWGCQRFGSPCRIYIHADVSKSRENAIAELGAVVTRIAGDYDETVRLTKREAEENGWSVVSDTSWPGYTETPRDVMAGYGVMTQEVCESMQQAPTHVFLQGGVGGLAAGVIARLRQYWGDKMPKVVIVEPELAACLFASAKTGVATSVNIEEETVMAGLSCGEPSELAWEILAEEADDFLTIPESLVAPTVRLLARPSEGDEMIEAGESAVAGLAALLAIQENPNLTAKLQLNAQSCVLLIGSEGITDPVIYAEIMKG